MKKQAWQPMGAFRDVREQRRCEMAGNKDQRGAEPPKPESASKPAKRAYEGRGRERASKAGQSHKDSARDEPRAPETPRKGGER
jgi:hypothetical protein